MTEQLGTTVSRLPVLPLRGLVAFPNMIIHFDVGRLLSIRALEAAMKNGQTLFLTAQRDLKTDNPSPSDLYQIGTICQVKQILRLPGDNIRVLVEGKQRALVHQFFAAQDDKTCIYAEVEQLEDYVYGVTERRAQALVRTAQERFAEYADNAQRISPDVELTVAEGGDAGFLADYIAQNISIEVAAKQDILEELSITRRLTMVIRLLGEETEVLKLENEIQDEVKSQMDKNQREYYLREQIKVIQTELGEQDAAAEAETYRQRILDLKLPQECEEKLIREVDRFAKLGGSNAEQGVVRTYLDTVLDLPWRSRSEERLDLEEAQRILDRDHYGMKKVKERIMEFLAVRTLAPSLKGQVLCLAGPPGRRQDLYRAIHRGGDGPQLCPHVVSAACAMRPTSAVTERPTSAQCPAASWTRCAAPERPDPLHPARRDRQDGQRFPRRSGLCDARGARHRAERRVPRPLYRAAVRPVRCACSSRRRTIFRHCSASAARPHGGHRAAELHRGGEAPDRAESPAAAPDGQAWP